MEQILHQLRLVVYPIIYWLLWPSQVVFWTINSFEYVIILGRSPCDPPN